LKYSQDKTVVDYLTESGSDSHSKLAQDIKASLTQYIQFLKYSAKG
jgi:hypothetical protein